MSIEKLITKIFEEIQENKKVVNEVSSSSDKLFGGTNVKIPVDGAHAGQSNWASSNAWDIAGKIGTPVYALASGKATTFSDYGKNVIATNGKKLYGQSFTVKSDGGLPSIYYTHLEGSPIRLGSQIECGDFLGYVMDFPGSTYDHVHIGVESGNIRQFLNDDGTIKCAKGQVMPGIEMSEPSSSDSLDFDERSEKAYNYATSNSTSKVEPKFKESDVLGLLNVFQGLTETKNMFSEAMVKPSAVASSYPDLIFASRTLGDDINQALLNDLQAAAKLTGYKINVNFAKTDHGQKTASGNVSRHWTNQAVDIGSIGGKVVSLANRDVVDRYVNALVGMGYTKNAEGGNAKSVLTFGFPAHDDHIHVSNTTGTPSQSSSTSDTSTSTSNTSTSTSNTSTETSGSEPAKRRESDLLGLSNSLQGVNESRSFGKDVTNRYGRIIIPKDSNSKIETPISGKINNKKYFPGCVNQVTIENNENEKVYLQYCGISNPKRFRDGDTVSIGEKLGTTDTDVTVNLFDYKWSIIPISDREFGITPKAKEKETETKKNPGEKSYYDPITMALLGAPFEMFKNKYDDAGNQVEKRYGGVSDKQQVDPWILNFLEDPFKRKKVTESINRIKKML